MIPTRISRATLNQRIMQAGAESDLSAEIIGALQQACEGHSHVFVGGYSDAFSKDESTCFCPVGYLTMDRTGGQSDVPTTQTDPVLVTLATATFEGDFDDVMGRERDGSRRVRVVD